MSSLPGVTLAGLWQITKNFQEGMMTAYHDYHTPSIFQFTEKNDG
jgi:hypothetical protein